MNTDPKMQRLIDVPDESFGRGMVLYVPDHAEDTAYCYMLVDMSAYGVGMALVEATGYHAGIIYVVLPSDCLTKGTRMVSKDWLIKNARYYLEDGTSLEEVYCMQYLPTPECPGSTNTPMGQIIARTFGKPLHYDRNPRPGNVHRQTAARFRWQCGNDNNVGQLFFLPGGEGDPG